MIALSHTHAGPSICRGDSNKPGGHLIEGYLCDLRQKLIDATREAIGNAASAVFTFATGRCDLATNRDLPDAERPRVVCGFNPAVPADDTVVVGRATDAQGRTIATLVNYACHGTTLAWENRLISPDFVGAMREVVEANTGAAPCLFLQGAAGELSPREQYVGDTAIADANGRQLGFATLTVVESMLTPETELAYTGVVESGAPLATWSRRPFQPSTLIAARQIDVEMPIRPLPSKAEVQRELEICSDRTMAERLRRKLRVIGCVGSGATSHQPAWIWRVGDAIFVGQPNEAYSLLQTELRRRVPEHPIFIMNVVNGTVGYLSPPELYDTDIYQVWQSPFERAALPNLINACEKGIRQLEYLA